MSGYAWVTLATNDSYSLGALVLAHSLKKCNTIHKLAVLITPAVSQPMREQLQSIYNVVKVVDVLDSKDEAHLALMKRPELGITFTKIHCWMLTEFAKCVFLDADTLVVRNCDELFEREEFSAAPDVGWPDCFNSGVFVYKPSVTTFNEILKFAVEKGSFDGGDQGLLNQYFAKWATEDIRKHLPFVYNLTTIAVYSYIPAFKHYGSETRIVHFIGAGKPWLQKLNPATRKVAPAPGSEHLTPLLQNWWDLFTEKVHPKLDKNLDFANGVSSLPKEACSNNLAVEPQTPDLREPLTSYRQPNDFRQLNLPYHPVVVKDPSGKTSYLRFLPVPAIFLTTNDDDNKDRKEQERANETQLEEETVATFEKINERSFDKMDEEKTNGTESKRLEKRSFDTVDADELQRMKETNQTDFFENVKKIHPNLECLPTELEIKPIGRSVTCEFHRRENSNALKEDDQKSEETVTEFKGGAEKEGGDYDDFNFPDEVCISNYLEKNVEVYQPLQNQVSKQCGDPNVSSSTSNEVVQKKEESSHSVPPLPRFLTIPEGDKRQSGNCSLRSSSPPVNKPTKEKFKITNLNVEVSHKTSVETYHNTNEPGDSNFPAVEAEDPFVGKRAKEFPLSRHSIITENQEYNFLKLKSKPNLEMDRDGSSSESSTAGSTSEAKHPSKDVRKYSLPKLRPLLPRQSFASKNKASFIPKITHYTEFLMSSEYKEPVDLPKDKIGFVESHISLLRQESGVVVAGGKFGPILYTSSANVEESSGAMNPKKLFKQLDIDPEVYNLKACRRQLGNKPKEHSLPKTSTHIFPALKPLLPLKNKKSTLNMKRKSKETPLHLVEKRVKKRSEPWKCNKEEKRSIIAKGAGTETTFTDNSSTEEILKRLFNFSKDYLHYFGKENDKREVGKRSPFSYEDYDSTDLKGVMRSAWSNLKTEGTTASSVKMIFGNNVQDIPADSLIADKNISNNKFTVEEQIKEKAKSGYGEIKRVPYLMAPLEKQKPEIAICKEFEFYVKRDIDSKKSSSIPRTEIVLLRTARIWRKKFQVLIAAIENFKKDQVQKKSIMPLPWKEKCAISSENFTVKSSEGIEQSSREKIINKESGNCENEGIDVSEERFFPKNVNKSQESPTTEINLIKRLTNCSSGSQVLRELGNKTKPSSRAKYPTYSINLNGFACSGDAHKYNKNESTHNVAESFDKRQHPTEKKGKATNSKKKKIKKQFEPLCVSNFETPRSSRVDLASNGPVSNIANGRITAAVPLGEEKQEQGTPLTRCFVVPVENSKISLMLLADSQKTPLPSSVSKSALAPAAKRNERLNRGKKLKSREILSDKFPRETFDVAPNAQFADYPVSPCRECLENDTIFEAAEPKHEMAVSGLAGTIAQLNLDSGDRKESSESPASSAYQDYMRRQNWETGNMDYMGKDSFDNIWSKICEIINKKALEDLKGNVEVLKAGDQNASLESEMGKLQLKSEKEILGSIMNDGMSPTKTLPGKQTEITGKIAGQPNKDFLPNVEKPTANNNLSKNMVEEIKPAQMASDKQVPSTIAPSVQPAGIERSKEPNSFVCSNVPGTDLKITDSPALPKTPCLANNTKSPQVVQQCEAKAPQPVTPFTKPPLITETPATPISEKKEDEPKLSPAAKQQGEPPKGSPPNVVPSQQVTPDAKQISPDSQNKVDSSRTKEDKPNSANTQTSNTSAVPAPNVDTKITSLGQVTPNTPAPELKTKEPIVSTLINSPVTPQIETKPKEPAAELPLTTLASTLPTPPLPTPGSVVEPKMNAPASAEALPEQPKGTSLPQQIMTSATNKGAKEVPIMAPLAAAVDVSKIAPQLEPKLKSEQQLQTQTESPPTNKPASESAKQECGVKLSDILDPKGPAGTERKDKPQAQTQEQGKNTAVVPYCDVLKQAQGPEEKVETKEKQKPRSQRSIEELKKRQSEIKASQLPPIALPDSPVKTHPDLPQSDGKIESSQPVPQQVTSGENKDPCPKTSGESSLKDNGKQKKGVFSKILEIVGVSPKEKKEDQTDSSKSVFYDSEGIPPAGKKQDLLTNESSIKTVSEVPEKSATDAAKTQGEKTSTKANEGGVPTSKSPLDEAKTTNIDKTKDVNCDKKKTSNMLQSETEGGNKQKGKETQPKQEDSQSGNKKNKSKAKPPRNNAPSPPKKTEETKQPDNKDKKKESPNAKTGQKQEPKAAEVLAPSTTSKEAKDSSAKPEVAVEESKMKDLEKKLFSEEKIKSDLDDILNKAKTEVEARMQEKKQEGGEGVVPDAGEVVNTMKLIVGENNKTENQAAGKKDVKNVQQNKQKPQQKDAKFNKRGPQGGHQPPPLSGKMEEIEEVKVTSEEERKKHKGQVTSSKLSDQILKAIPPPRRKAISESKGDSQNASASDSEKASSEATVPPPQQQQQPPQLPPSENAKPQPDASKPANAAEATPVPAPAQAAIGKPLSAAENVKQTSASQADGKKGEGKGKTSSGPVPPPRNRPKPAQPTTQKNKSKK